MNMQIGPAPEEERTRNYESNGVKYKLKAYDPHGFVTVTCLKTNKNLEGTFTSFLEAERAAIQHAIKFNTKE